MKQPTPHPMSIMLFGCILSLINGAIFLQMGFHLFFEIGKILYCICDTYTFISPD